MEVAIIGILAMAGVVVICLVKWQNDRAQANQNQQQSGNGSVTINAPEVSEKLKMAQVKCAQCGSGIEPGSKFCKFCGTAVPDDVFRAEIKVEDTGKIMEERRIAKQAEKEKKNRKVMAIVLLALAIPLIIWSFTAKDHPEYRMVGIITIVAVGYCLLRLYLNR